MDHHELKDCVLCKAAEILGDNLGSFEFETGGMAPAAVTLPDPKFGNAFPPPGTKTTGLFLATQILDIKPSPEFDSDLWVTIGLCLGTFTQSDLFVKMVALLRSEFRELQKLQYYHSEELNTPEKCVFVLRYRI